MLPECMELTKPTHVKNVAVLLEPSSGAMVLHSYRPEFQSPIRLPDKSAKLGLYRLSLVQCNCLAHNAIFRSHGSSRARNFVQTE